MTPPDDAEAPAPDPAGDADPRSEAGLALAPLFPLPHGALLPGELLPLHLFEPRYRAMMAAVRKGDRVIAVATLQPGWEADYKGRPAVADIVGLGRVVKDRLNPDGTSDIVLHGLLRGEIVAEISGREYRVARISPHSEDDLHPAEVYRLRRELLRGIAERLKSRAFVFDLTAGFDVGALADRIAAALDLEPAERVAILQAVNVERRVSLLLELLTQRKHRQRLVEIMPSLHSFSLALERGRGPELRR
ncbi:MAG: LON peptidase substrate-binding domain-containing protein [Planctomycetota bacterium]